jgi:sortase A
VAQQTEIRPAADEAHLARRRRLGRALQILGALLLLAGVGIGGYLAWLLWGTGLETRRAQAELREGFVVGAKRLAEAPPADRVVKLPGRAVAILVIPKLDLDAVVVEGTDTEALKKGPGHYTQTAYPWEERGRVGIAGHRTTYGAPFWSLDRLRPGDPIILKTEYGIFRYVVTRSAITPPSGILPSGAHVLEQTRRPTLVLTTCHPRFSASQRLVVFADRVGG